MNAPSKSPVIRWQKWAIVAVILGVAGYQWCTGETHHAPQDDGRSVATSSADQNSDTSPSGQCSLKKIGNQRYQSPAGLIYGMGFAGESRLEHVMKHAQDNPSRPAHGVFNGDQNEILKLIDEAYEMVDHKSKYVEAKPSRGNMQYTVSMGRAIGYEGGKNGKFSHHRSLNHLRLILDGNQVITAYPYP